MNHRGHRGAQRTAVSSALLCVTYGFAVRSFAQPATVEMSGYAPSCGVQLTRTGEDLRVEWQTQKNQRGLLVFDLRPGTPLLRKIATAGPEPDRFGGELPWRDILCNADLLTSITVGTRRNPPGRPPGMSIFNVFFDSPAQRPHETFAARLDKRSFTVTYAGRRATIHVGDVEAGPFRGELAITLYVGTPLVHAELVVTTSLPDCAFSYATRLSGVPRGEGTFLWIDTEGRTQSSRDTVMPERALAVRHRTVVYGGDRGALACFPPPHQFFFPRDLTDNLKTVTISREGGPLPRVSLGIRQPIEGGGSFVPWFNAPPGTQQRLGLFLLLDHRGPMLALAETLRLTHFDHFPTLPGYRTFTSHWHMAIAEAAMKRQAAGQTPITPDWVGVFKGLGVEMVHLGEFHGDGHQRDPGPLRLPEMRAMFDECRRLSSSDFLVIPGEELSGILGIDEPGKHPGHWMSLFPKPVYFTQVRASGQPFEEEIAPFGKVYHAGSREDMFELLKREGGLAWTAHPRIKASNWTPDIFRHEDFYLSDRWLGAAWKAMPADVSRERLGERALDLLDDMANWGQRKYMPGEVDVFKIDHTHELYGHMNVNYVKLDRVPRFDEGWQPVLDALRGGHFFVTTGELLIRRFTAGGVESGSTIRKPGDTVEVVAELEWTFPMKFVEVISGDGEKTFRQRIELSDTGTYGRRTVRIRVPARGRKWLRLEAWDVAANGAFTQPVWLEP